MTTEQHKLPVIQVREKLRFCDICIQNNAMGQCENIVARYVNIIRSTPYEEDDNDIDIHNPMYLADYERISDLVVPSEFLQTCFILILICLHIYLFIFSFHYFCTFVGDIFAMNADPQNVQGVDYYLLRCTKKNQVD